MCIIDTVSDTWTQPDKDKGFDPQWKLQEPEVMLEFGSSALLAYYSSIASVHQPNQIGIK